MIRIRYLHPGGTHTIPRGPTVHQQPAATGLNSKTSGG
jgi:hypothetical protein